MSKLADKQLHQSDEQFRLLIEHASDLIAILRGDGTFEYASPSNERVLGYQPEELVGQSAFDIVHPDDAARVRSIFASAIQTAGLTPFIEFRFRHKDGSWRFIEAVGNNLFDQASGAARVVINARDITERKHAEEAQQQEAQISGALARVGHVLIAALDTSDLLTRLCQVTAEVLGCDSSQTLLFRPNEDAFTPIAGYGATPEEQEAAKGMKVPRSMMSVLLARLESDDVAEVGTIPPDLLSKPEQERFGVTLVLCMTLRRGKDLIGLQVALSRNRRESFTETERRIARGVAQVASLALEHARVVSELARANQLKSEFVATMSHELRTPMSVITGYTDLLLEGVFGTLTPEQVDTVQKVQRSSRELLTLINSTLDLSRLEAGEPEVEFTDVCLADLIEEVDSETRGLQERSPLGFLRRVTPDLRVRTDPGKLKVVLKNLIGNAIKYTDRGTVTLEAYPAERGIEISVADTGIGIAPEALAIIFEPFRQADGSSTRRHGGVGLGLYIVRRLLDILGGSISVESELGRGSTFRVWLPEYPQ
jgi:PAS domain S-box-containing protein